MKRRLTNPSANHQLSPLIKNKIYEHTAGYFFCMQHQHWGGGSSYSMACWGENFSITCYAESPDDAAFKALDVLTDPINKHWQSYRLEDFEVIYPKNIKSIASRG